MYFIPAAGKHFFFSPWIAGESRKRRARHQSVYCAVLQLASDRLRVSAWSGPRTNRNRRETAALRRTSDTTEPSAAGGGGHKSYFSAVAGRLYIRLPRPAPSPTLPYPPHHPPRISKERTVSTRATAVRMDFLLSKSGGNRNVYGGFCRRRRRTIRYASAYISMTRWPVRHNARNNVALQGGRLNTPLTPFLRSNYSACTQFPVSNPPEDRIRQRFIERTACAKRNRLFRFRLFGGRRGGRWFSCN